MVRGVLDGTQRRALCLHRSHDRLRALRRGDHLRAARDRRRLFHLRPDLHRPEHRWRGLRQDYSRPDPCDRRRLTNRLRSRGGRDNRAADQPELRWPVPAHDRAEPPGSIADDGGLRRGSPCLGAGHIHPGPGRRGGDRDVRRQHPDQPGRLGCPRDERHRRPRRHRHERREGIRCRRHRRSWFAAGDGADGRRLDARLACHSVEAATGWPRNDQLRPRAGLGSAAGRRDARSVPDLYSDHLGHAPQREFGRSNRNSRRDRCSSWAPSASAGCRNGAAAPSMR